VETVLSTSGIRSADRHAIKKLGVPQALLMENAGRSVAEAATDILGDARGKSVSIFCGKGNNGGDGFVAARHLIAVGAHVRVILLARLSALRGETLRQYKILKRIGPVAGRRLNLTIATDVGRITPGSQPLLVIDAIFGTGYSGKLKGAAKKAVNLINDADCPVVSVDMPSGLNSDDGSVVDACVKADVCVTMGALKTGLLIGRGPEFSGRIRVADLGVGMETIVVPGKRVFLIRGGDIGKCLPQRARNSHKHSVGKILVLAGSVGLTGAAALSATAAVRSGAGAVVLGVPRSIFSVLAKKMTEVMVKPLPDSPDGRLSPTSLGAIKKELDWADVILVGPGLGMGGEVHDFIENLLKLRNKRLLIDADGLNHIAGDRALQSHFKKNTCILTPHAGEFSRLSGFSYGEIEKGRIDLAGEYARDQGISLVLKGSPTVTADNRRRVFINSTGGPGMATAGMGDVLAGVISALWAETGDPIGSAYGGVFIHGHAGDLVKSSMGERAMLAGDLLNKLPETMKMFESN